MASPSAKTAADGSTRRRFLQQLTVGAGAAGLGLFSPGAWGASERIDSKARAPLSPTSTPQDVIVIGAGLAGLAAAWELDRGHPGITEYVEGALHSGIRATNEVNEA